MARQLGKKVLTANKFRIESQKEADSFLYFSMKLVIDSLTDAYANQWTSNELLTDFAFKVKWLKARHSIKQPFRMMVSEGLFY